MQSRKKNIFLKSSWELVRYAVTVLGQLLKCEKFQGLFLKRIGGAGILLVNDHQGEEYVVPCLYKWKSHNMNHLLYDKRHLNSFWVGKLGENCNYSIFYSVCLAISFSGVPSIQSENEEGKSSGREESVKH